MKLENVENQKLHHLCYDTITDCDIDVRKAPLARNNQDSALTQHPHW